MRPPIEQGRKRGRKPRLGGSGDAPCGPLLSLLSCLASVHHRGLWWPSGGSCRTSKSLRCRNTPVRLQRWGQAGGFARSYWSIPLQAVVQQAVCMRLVTVDTRTVTAASASGPSNTGACFIAALSPQHLLEVISTTPHVYIFRSHSLSFLHPENLKSPKTDICQSSQAAANSTIPPF